MCNIGTVRAGKLPWILLGASLTFNGTPRYIQGNRNRYGQYYIRITVYQKIIPASWCLAHQPLLVFPECSKDIDNSSRCPINGGMCYFRSRWHMFPSWWHEADLGHALCHVVFQKTYPDSKVHAANMGPTWVLSAPDGPHVGPMNLVTRVNIHICIFLILRCLIIFSWKTRVFVSYTW